MCQAPPCQGPCLTLQLSEMGSVLTPFHSRGSGDPDRVAQSQSPSLEGQCQSLDLTAAWLPSSVGLRCSWPSPACPTTPHSLGTPWGSPSTFSTQTPQPSPAQQGERERLPSHHPVHWPHTPPPSRPARLQAGGRRPAGDLQEFCQEKRRQEEGEQGHTRLVRRVISLSRRQHVLDLAHAAAKSYKIISSFWRTIRSYISSL